MNDVAKKDQRMRLACPHCGSETRIRTSRTVSTTYRQLYLLCLDLECGFTFAADLTITHGLSPSAKPNPACHLRMAPARHRADNDSHPSRRRGPEVPPPAANEDSPADEATV